jgi:hypothetical protein
MKINQRTPINYPMATHISIQDHSTHYCTPGVSSEIAFFKKGKWVVDVVPEFADYFDGATGGDTLVYGHVPNELIDKFLMKWGG